MYIKLTVEMPQGLSGREKELVTEGIEIILSMRNQILEMRRELAALRHELGRRQSDHKLRCLEIPRERGLIIDYFVNAAKAPPHHR